MSLVRFNGDIMILIIPNITPTGFGLSVEENTSTGGYHLWATSACCTSPIHFFLDDGSGEMFTRCSDCENRINRFHFSSSGHDLTGPRPKSQEELQEWARDITGLDNLELSIDV